MLYKLCKLQFISPLKPHPGSRLIEFFRRVKPSFKNQQIRMEQNDYVMVKKSSIVKPLTCHLCSDIINDATTITACLHTFCKDCIYRAFQDGTMHSCPKCHEYLGPSPQTYLRPDPMLQNFRNQVFMYEKQKAAQAAPSLSPQKEVEDKENGKSAVKTKDAESKKDESSASVGD